jgi:hypothetical protein
MSDFNTFNTNTYVAYVELAPAYMDLSEYSEPESVAFATAMNTSIFDCVSFNSSATYN